MIIECISCDKKFEVNSNLIPNSGRTIQCGSCNYVWFFVPKKVHSKIFLDFSFSNSFESENQLSNTCLFLHFKLYLIINFYNQHLY